MAVQKKAMKIDTNDYTKGGTASVGTRVKTTGGSGSFVMPNGANLNAPQAMNGQDAMRLDPATNLWQSFNTMGQNQIRESDKMFDRNLSEADRQAMSRGMGRSSYNNQTLANIRQERTEAANKINADTVAQYQQALNALQQQQQQQQNWQAEFDANQQYQQQQGAMQYLNMILQNGGTPSDQLLQQAGLSRADYNAMKKQQATGGGGYRPRTNQDANGNGNGNGNGGTGWESWTNGIMNDVSLTPYINAINGYSSQPSSGYSLQMNTYPATGKNKNGKRG